MGALLQRKQAVESRLDAQRVEPVSTVPTAPPEHLATDRPPAAALKTPTGQTSAKPPAAESTEQDGMSTTERLLAMKRRRRDTDDDEN